MNLFIEGRAAAVTSVMMLPLFTSKASCGFPSPAEDHQDVAIDLNQALIHNPPATFFVRATGDSMIGAGIFPGDLLVVDRSLEPRDGKVVVAALDNLVMVKRLRRMNGRMFLVADNPQKNYPPILLKEEADCVSWGVVIWVIHQP